MLLVVIAALAAALVVEHRRSRDEIARLDADVRRAESEAALARAEALQIRALLEAAMASQAAPTGTTAGAPGSGTAKGK
jgi:hypothetical protein